MTTGLQEASGSKLQFGNNSVKLDYHWLSSIDTHSL